ncbi:hypothetical protein QR680_008694 [Steinernema hermaphroditum]|uniref:C-type lectin domain-containing protein n=1 Tax=Steinernema hermaphroditum TaxID=289476 RepID=A0AA39IHJ5_9BILA|nr:hypothetical protein QR680_008694 [Steinernema hermaphroditum]
MLAEHFLSAIALTSAVHGASCVLNEMDPELGPWYPTSDGRSCFDVLPVHMPFWFFQFDCAIFRYNQTSVHNEADNDLIRAHFNTTFWLGGSDNSTGTWTWTDGSPFNYSNWAAGEPSNVKGKACLAVDSDTGLWSAEDCNRNMPSTCLATN